MENAMTYQPIANYGVIGDLHSVALVGMDGSLDLMSFPSFDSPTIFCALLDHERFLGPAFVTPGRRPIRGSGSPGIRPTTVPPAPLD